MPSGDAVNLGLSVGSTTNIPQGPWPATVTLVVQGANKEVYSGVPVNQTTGWIGWATITGQLTISVAGTASYSGTSQTVTTH